MRGGDHAVLRVNAMGGNGRVSSKAAGVGVLRVDVWVGGRPARDASVSQTTNDNDKPKGA